MDGDTVTMGGGFGSPHGHRMGAAAQRMAERADAEHEQAGRELERERAIAAEERWERTVLQEVANRQAAGEEINVQQVWKTNGRSLGHTHRESLELAVARMDAEDARQAAAERAAFRRWQAERNAETSASVGVIEAESIARRQETDELRPAYNERRKRRREITSLIRTDRRLREMGFKGF